MFVSSVLDIAQRCTLVDRSYCHKPERCPVRSWIRFSATLASNTARKGSSSTICAGTGVNAKFLFADALPLGWHLTLAYSVFLTHDALLTSEIRAYWIFTNFRLPLCYPAFYLYSRGVVTKGHRVQKQNTYVDNC